jgi:hypothetical protein
MTILDTFGCPVYFVYGNWDNKVEYFSLDRDQHQQIHLNGFNVGDVYLTGFSGCPTG